MAFNAITDSNPLSVVVTTAGGAFDPFAPVSTTNPLPVVGSNSTAAFVPYAPITETNPLPMDVVTGSTFDKFGPITSSNPLPIAPQTAPGTFDKFAPITSTNPLPVYSPWLLDNKAAIYSLRGGESDSTYLTNGLGRVKLIADRSGNSNVNCFVSNGVVASNTATTSTKSLTGSLSWSFDLAAEDYTPASTVTIFSTITGNNGVAVQLLTTGVVRFRVGDGASITDVDSTTALTLTDLARGTIGIVWTDGVGASFTQNGSALGSAVAAAKTLAYSATTATVGPFGGRIYSITEVASGYNFAPATFSKLAGSGSSGGSTWTINASGDLGARICGERDLYQATTTKMAAFSTSNGINIATFDGSNDYMKAASFSLSQPETVYFVGSQVTWTSGKNITDGSAASQRMIIEQRTTTPSINLFVSTSAVANTSWTLNTRAVIAAVFNGASSSLRVNRGTASTGDPGTQSANGFTLSADIAGGSSANITVSEVLLFSAAHDEATQLKVAGAEMQTFQIS